MDKKLGFFIVGAQKSGTTALFAKLTSHPEIAAPVRKELHVFNRTGSDPHSVFADAFQDCDPHLLWGEATPAYMFWPGAIERLATYNARAKLIVILRHPAERALSQWRMQRGWDVEPLSFKEAISPAGRARLNDCSDTDRLRHSYVERGFYAQQITQMLLHIPRAQISFCTTEELHDAEAELLSHLFTFLGVDPEVQITGEKMIRPNDNAHIQIDAGPELEYLADLYKDDIAQTALLTGLNLDHWLEKSYL